MKITKQLDLIYKINVELVRILKTEDLNIVRSWWKQPNTLFANTPIEYIIAFPKTGLKEILHWSKNCK